MQIGDIVSVMDEDDDGIYFAQIRGFLQDQFCEKSVVITWLVPTLNSPKDRFDPTTYILGRYLFYLKPIFVFRSFHELDQFQCLYNFFNASISSK